ncbi:hypothetical protein CL615_00800 [archaeon]|jgi:predicted ribosome quality control (RQC) complex YloA/Tae2 family protein|nr:hypothetical protein [archaeon]MDP6548019.1 NFACT family protein [Candidatus Woesearchaeota archaeon]|tara:strand:- start:10788 stop:11903 length:1116 start_codon:yes stop_codon:yes gene_type:complete
MVKQLSSVDMHFLVKELKELEGSRVDKIYNKGKEEVYIQVHKSGAGKKIIRIIVGKDIFLSSSKDTDESPSGFCMMLRKHLENMFIDSISQIEPERILRFVFKTKADEKSLYLEFFGKGNFILCSREDIIIDALIRQKFRDRSVMAKEKYINPEMKYNLFKLDKDKLSVLLKNSAKDKLIISLAVELGLGGVYSEEVFLLCKIDKDKEPNKIDEKEISKILASIKKIISGKKNVQIVYDTKGAVDIIPIDMEFYKENEKKKFPSFNEALDHYFTHEVKLIKKETAVEMKINELNRIIKEQKAKIKSMESKEDENKKKAELIYTNYNLIKEILTEINKATTKYPWEEIKKKLKGHKVVKEVDVKEKMVVVEV